jgi:signal peptidase II
MIVCAVVAYFYMKSNRNDTFFILALALIMGGSLGNLFDRVVFGYVIDYIDLKFFAVFNLADMAINVGVLLILFEIFRGSKCIQ